jgi:hypothetical protein
MNDSRSPGGRYSIAIAPWEVRMSLWIESPTLTDTETGEVLLSFRDPHWSLDSADWRSDSVVALELRKYPGNHTPVQVTATVDCEARTAEVGAVRVESLKRLEKALDEALVWDR